MTYPLTADGIAAAHSDLETATISDWPDVLYLTVRQARTIHGMRGRDIQLARREVVFWRGLRIRVIG